MGKARMNWRNMVSGGCKVSVSIDFYFIWGMARDKSFRESLFAGLILVYLLCLETSRQTFLGRGGGVSICGLLEQGRWKGLALHWGPLRLRGAGGGLVTCCLAGGSRPKPRAKFNPGAGH